MKDEGCLRAFFELTKAVISKATFLSLFVIAACPQAFWVFRKIPDKRE
jgi:hypothetical protein